MTVKRTNGLTPVSYLGDWRGPNFQSEHVFNEMPQHDLSTDLDKVVLQHLIYLLTPVTLSKSDV